MTDTAIDLKLKTLRPRKPEDFWNYPSDAELYRAIDSLRHGGPNRCSLLVGDNSTGKTSLAYYCGMWASCGNPLEDGLPCGQCKDCLRVMLTTAGLRNRFYELDGNDDTFIKDFDEAYSHLYDYGLSVLDALQVSRASRHNKKPGIIFIDEAHSVTGKAQKQMLKRVEENNDLRFIFATTEPEKIDPGMMQRMDDSYHLTRPDYNQSVRGVRHVAAEHGGSVTERAAGWIVERAKTSPRKCLGILGTLMKREHHVTEDTFIGVFGRPLARPGVPTSA